MRCSWVISEEACPGHVTHAFWPLPSYAMHNTCSNNHVISWNVVVFIMVDIPRKYNQLLPEDDLIING